jgi:glutathione S-transferase
VTIRVYRIPFSTNVERVALALGLKDLAAEWIDLDPLDRSPVRDISGQDLVPVAVFEDGTILADSTAILEELERRHPDPPLYPADEAARAEVEIFVDWFNRVWKRAPNDLEAELTSGEPDAGRVRALERELSSSRDLFERLLAGRGYLFGDRPSVADIVAFPFLKYGLIYDPGDDEPFHKILIEHLALGASYPRLEAWLRRVDTLPRS